MNQSFDDFTVARLPALLRFSGVLTADRQLSEDIVQDALLKAQKRWDRISGLDQPEYYVRRMIVNEFISWRRKWARVVPRADPEDRRMTQPDHASAHAERDALAARVQRLPPKQRAVIFLRYYEDLADKDIAAVLGCGAGTVRSHVSRALASLRIDEAPAEQKRVPIATTGREA